MTAREDESQPGEADPYRPPAAEAPAAAAAAARGKGRLVLRIVEWTLGAPMVLLGLAQCGIATLFFALSFVADGGWPRSLSALLFSNGLTLVVPGALLCAGRSWAAWFVLVFGIASLALGFAATHLPFVIFGSLLAGFAVAILVLAALVRHGRRHGPCGEADESGVQIERRAAQTGEFRRP